MQKDRLTAFSDGVIAIIITIMVLELKAPATADLEGLKRLVPGLVSYLLSFIYVAIYWNNHHHMLHMVRHVNGLILWANTHLLFWLSLMPLAAAWMGAHYFDAVPVATYGLALLMPAIAYMLLQRAIIRSQGTDSPLALALGRDFKGKISPLLYLTAIGAAFAATAISHVIYAAVAAMWLIPDRRIERALRD